MEDVADHMAYMRRRKAKKRERKLDIQWNRFQRLIKDNPSHSIYNKPNQSIPNLQYEPPVPPQIISTYNNTRKRLKEQKVDKKIGKSVRLQNRLVQKLAHVKVVQYVKYTNI